MSALINLLLKLFTYVYKYTDVCFVCKKQMRKLNLFPLKDKRISNGIELSTMALSISLVFILLHEQMYQIQV